MEAQREHMAIAFPPVYLACAAANDAGGGSSETKQWRLSPDRVLDLRDVALGVEESRAGVGCRYLIDHLAGGGGSPEADEDGYISKLADVEKFIERFGDWGKHEAVRDWRGRIARCRRALAALRKRGDHKSANVLMVAYGPRDACAAATDVLSGWPRELAALAKYVDAVEVKRLEMAREEARRPPSTGSFGHWFALRNSDEKRVPKLGEVRGPVIDIVDYQERYARAERAITSGDALRVAIAAFPEPVVVRRDGEGVLSFEARKASRKERQEAHKEKLDSFLREVRGEARHMLYDAERRYYERWLENAVEHP